MSLEKIGVRVSVRGGINRVISSFKIEDNQEKDMDLSEDEKEILSSGPEELYLGYAHYLKKSDRGMTRTDIGPIREIIYSLEEQGNNEKR